MAVNSELTRIELAVRNLIYRELGVVLQRATFLPNVHVIRTQAHYELIRKMVATEQMNRYVKARDSLIAKLMKKLTDPDPTDATWDPITEDSYVVQAPDYQVLNIPDSQTLTYAKFGNGEGMTKLPEDYSIYYSGTPNGSYAYSVDDKILKYQAPTGWTGWDRLQFIINADPYTVRGWLYIQSVVPSPTDELIRSMLPAEYVEPRNDLYEWIAKVTDVDVVTWYVKTPPAENANLYVELKESYPDLESNGEQQQAPYFDYCDTSLRMDQSTGTLYLWNRVKKKFESSAARLPDPGPVPTDTMSFDSLSYNGLYYPVTHVTNDWSSLATSESHNIVLRSNVSISIDLVKQGIAPAEIYYYLVKVTNTVANSVVLNTTVSPVSSIDNKPRTCELYLRRDEYLGLNGYKLLAQLRATALEDLSRVFLVH